MKELLKQRIKFIIEEGGVLGPQDGSRMLRVLVALLALNVLLNLARLLLK